MQKPISTNLETARRMIDTARKAGILLGVVTQHRFDDSSQFLKKAIAGGRLGKILQADAYVKWYRSAEYYSRPIKGSWATEGGGALINQAVHQVDVLQWLVGDVTEVFGYWQLGALHKIESEDVVNAMLRYGNGATGVIQASTAFWPGYSERLEIHGTKGTAIITGDKLTTWDVDDDAGEPPPVDRRRRLRRLRSDGHFAYPVRAPVPRLRRCDSHRPQAADRRRRRLQGAGDRDVGLPVLPGRHARDARRRGQGRLTGMHGLVRVPASSANLGPGFDALGMALGLYLECRFAPDSELQITASGRDAAAIPTAKRT